MKIPHKFWESLLKALAAYAVFLVIAWLLSFAINDEVDRRILLAINPDTRLPLLDEFFIGLTDFSMALVGALAIGWEIGFIVYRKSQKDAKKASNFLQIFGGVAGTVFFVGTWLFGYVLWGFFPVLALVTWGAFWALSKTYGSLTEKEMFVFQKIILLMLLAALFSLIGEYFIKYTVKRPRPLNDANASWNGVLTVFADETVRGHYSYFSGHSSGLFAGLTPLAWGVKSKKSKVLLWVWAGIHAFSRIYVAAHFPFCVLIGSLSGFIAGTAIYFAFRIFLKK
jgi:undecaprenyl-diphosphatase